MKKLLTVGFVLASAAALATDYTAWNNEDMALGDDDTLTISANTTVTAGKLTGTGKVTINSGVTLTDSTLFGEGFTGTIEVNGGTFEWKGGGNPKTNIYTAASKIILTDGGKLRETSNGVNLYMTNNVAIFGSGNEIYSNDANVWLQGNLSGSGSVKLQTYKRGVRLCGDNSGFTGSATLAPLAADWQAHGFYANASGSANASWTVEGVHNTTIDGWTYTACMVGVADTAENALHLGAFNVTNPQALISTCASTWKESTARTYLVIGEKSEDCTIEGGFSRSPVTFTKKGTAKLTLGTNFTCVAGSQMTVEAGTLEVNGDATNLLVTVLKSGATLTGKGKVRVKAIEAGATITGSINVVFAGDQDTLVYNMDQVPFDDSFTGSVIITNGTKVTWQGTSFKESSTSSVFGKTPTLVLAGGCLKGFKNSNNQLLTGAIQAVDGTCNAITNDAATYMNGVNLSCQAALMGKGSLEFHQKDRWLKFSGSNANFGGAVRITGASSNNPTASSSGDSNGTYFESADSGSAAASWTHDRKAWLKLQQAADSTIKFGALNITANTPATYVANNGTTVEIGGNNDDSAINNPFLGKSFTLKKVGYGNLTFADTVTFQTGTTFAVAPAADGVTGPGDPTGVAGAATEYALLTLPSGSTATVIQPTKGDDYNTFVTKRGKWRVVTVSKDDGSTTYKLVWSPNGLMIIVR